MCLHIRLSPPCRPDVNLAIWQSFRDKSWFCSEYSVSGPFQLTKSKWKTWELELLSEERISKVNWVSSPARNRAVETSSWNLKVFSRNQFAPILRHNDFDLPTMDGWGWGACTWKLLTTSLPENLPACRKLCSIAQLGITFARFQQLAALLHYKSFQHLNVGKLHFQATGCTAGHPLHILISSHY